MQIHDHQFPTGSIHLCPADRQTAFEICQSDRICERAGQCHSRRLRQIVLGVRDLSGLLSSDRRQGIRDKQCLVIVCHAIFIPVSRCPELVCQKRRLIYVIGMCRFLIHLLHQDHVRIFGCDIVCHGNQIFLHPLLCGWLHHRASIHKKICVVAQCAKSDIPAQNIQRLSFLHSIIDITGDFKRFKIRRPVFRDRKYQ